MPARRSEAVVAWYAATDHEPLFLSALVVGEIRNGIERLAARDSAQAQALGRWLTELRAEFAGRVLPVDAEVAECWGRLEAKRPLPVEDGLMAATAIIHGLTFVTRNVADVAGTGVELLNPWEHPPERAAHPSVRTIGGGCQRPSSTRGFGQ